MVLSYCCCSRSTLAIKRWHHTPEMRLTQFSNLTSDAFYSIMKCLWEITQWTELMIQMTNANSLKVFPISCSREMFALPARNYPACNIQSGVPQTLTDYAAVCGIQHLTEWVNEVWLHIFICSLCFNLIYSKRRRSGAILHHINICLISYAAALVYFCKTAALLDTGYTEQWVLLVLFLHNSTVQ